MKKLFFSMICLSLAAITVFPSAARQWQKSSGGIRWVDEDGEWVRNTWEWIDDDWNGTAECYYFNSEGYRVENGKTPDNYTVNAHGQWTENGIVQTKAVSAGPAVSIQPAGSLIREEMPSQTINTSNVPFDSVGDPSLPPPDRLKKEKFDGFKWVVSTQNKKYHIIGCGDVQSIPDGSKFYSDDSAYLKHMGFRACAKCTGRVED